jgi:hypothetical protein
MADYITTRRRSDPEYIFCEDNNVIIADYTSLAYAAYIVNGRNYDKAVAYISNNLGGLAAGVTSALRRALQAQNS